MSFYLAQIANKLEADSGITTPANANDAGYWRRIAAAAEELAGAATSANDSEAGNAHRAAIAFGALSGISGVPYNHNEPGHLAWLVASLEALNSTTYSGSLESRFLQGVNGYSPSIAPPAAFAYQSETQTALTAYTAAGSTLGVAHSRQLDRLIRRGKTDGWWSPATVINLLMPTEAQFLINLKNPGTYNLTKVGSPTYSTDYFNANSANTNYYQTSLTLTDFALDGGTGTRINNTLMVNVVSGQTASNGIDAGAISTGESSRGLTITSYAAGSNLGFRAFGTSNTASSADGRYAGTGWYGITREASNTSVQLGKHGYTRQTLTTSAGTVNTTGLNLRLLQANGSTSQSVRNLGGWLVAKDTGLTQNQRVAAARAMQNWIDNIRHGCPYIEDTGVGEATISADIVVYGLTVPGIIAAYEAKRTDPTKTVVLLGDWLDETITDIGGHTAAGLGYVDTRDHTKVSGIFDDMIRLGKVIDGETYAQTQAGQSMTARAWNLVCRRMLDPTKSTGTLPGLDIKVYMTGGLHSVVKAGGSVTSVITNDGRTVTASQFIDADYIGDFVYKAGNAYTIGQEAAGSGYDADNGYRVPNRLMSHASVNYRPDPYVTPATPASGLLPDMVADPGTSAGTADPCIQSMNKRLAMTTTNHRTIPWTYVFAAGAPRNYSATRYELFARYCALVTANAATVSIDDVLNLDAVASGIYDCNNGTGGFSTDLPNIGLAMIAAGQDIEARYAVYDDYNDYLLGLFYFIMNSGDARVPAALIDAVDNYFFDALHFLDEGSHNFPGLPRRLYQREPVYQLVSDLVHTGADYYRADNAIAPTFDRYVGRVAYDFDKHAMRRVAYNDGSGVTAFGQGSFGGSDTGSYIGMGSITPPEAVATNVTHVCAPSFNKMFHSAARMEFSLALLGQSAGKIAVHAIDDELNVQDVDYTALRTALLADPDTVAMAI